MAHIIQQQMLYTIHFVNHFTNRWNSRKTEDLQQRIASREGTHYTTNHRGLWVVSMSDFQPIIVSCAAGFRSFQRYPCRACGVQGQGLVRAVYRDRVWYVPCMLCTGTGSGTCRACGVQGRGLVRAVHAVDRDGVWYVPCTGTGSGTCRVRDGVWYVPCTGTGSGTCRVRDGVWYVPCTGTGSGMCRPWTRPCPKTTQEPSMTLERKRQELYKHDILIGRGPGPTYGRHVEHVWLHNYRRLRAQELWCPLKGKGL